MPTDVLVTTEKQLALDLIQRLLPTVTLADIIDELDTLAGILRGKAALAAGQVVSHEEVRRSTAWRS